MKILVLLGFIVSIGIATAIGLFEAPDSIHYILLAQYLQTGLHIPAGPFNYTSPSTLFGPVYGLITTPVTSLPWPWGMILVPFLQLMLIVISAILLYRIFLKFLSKRAAIVGSMLFILYPFQVVYATYLLSETLSQFLLTVYLYTLFRLNQNRWATPDTLVFIAAILTLTRYVFVVLFIYSLIKYKPVRSPTRILFVAGITLLSLWIMFNFKTYGTLQLTSHTGRHIYNNVVTLGKLLPDSIPKGTEIFFTRIPQTKIYRPWWDNQLYFPDIKEMNVDRMFLTLSLSAIRSHPLSWLATVAYAFIHTPLTSAYEKAPYRSHQIHDILSNCTGEVRMSWNSSLKSTPIQNCSVNNIWIMFLSAQNRFYPAGAAVMAAFALVGLIVAVRSGGIRRQFAVIFFLIHLAQSATEWIEGRFLVPLYPLYVFFIILGIKICYSSVSEKSRILNNRHTRL